MLKVLLLSLDDSLFDPYSRSALRLKQYLNGLDLLCVIVDSSKKIDPIKLDEKLVVYSSHSYNKFCYLVKTLFLGLSLNRKFKFDLVSAQDPFLTGLASWLIKKFGQVKQQIQVHCDFFGSAYWSGGFKGKVRGLLIRFLLPRADGIRAVSQRIKSSLLPYVAEKKIVVAPVIIEFDQFKSGFNPTPELQEFFAGKKVILSLGRLVKEKRLDWLLKIFKNVNKALPDCWLAFVGSGPEKSFLQSMVKRLGLETRVKFFGYRTDVRDFYHLSSVLAITSVSEGSNRSVVEALASGTPVVMTNVGVADEIDANPNNRLVVGPDDQQGFEQALVKVLTDDNLRQNIIEQGLVSVSKLPEREAVIQKLLDSFVLASQN